MPLPTELLDYDLPPHLIAQTPAVRRDGSRLLVVDRRTRTWSHHLFSDLPQFLRKGDTLIRNRAAVLPARLHAKRPSGGAVECFLLRPTDALFKRWWCLLKPGRRLPIGAAFERENAFTARVLEKREDGTALVEFETAPRETIRDVANREGQVPLPPYIERAPTDAAAPVDRNRYQTVYADPAQQVAVAAPTAGLHFTPELLQTLTAAGVGHADLVLHVGLGTFKPIATPTIEEHPIHRETYEMAGSTQATLLHPPGRRIAVGTTSLRAIEDFLSRELKPSSTPFVTETSLFVYPPRLFRGADALITNFHQPRSTLLCLVGAFLTPGQTDGLTWLRELYREAIAREYRFFSYGDAMLIL